MEPLLEPENTENPEQPEQDFDALNSLEGLSADFGKNNDKYQGLELSLGGPHLSSSFTFSSVSVKSRRLCS